jgi:hypothetical protein
MNDIVTPGAPAAPPKNSAEARAVLDSRIADKDWGAKLLASDGATKTEYQQLRALVDSPDPSDRVELAMSGADLGFLPDSSIVQMSHVAEMLRDMGFPPTAIRETLSGKEATQADVDMANAWKTENLRSKEYVTRLMSGEPSAARQLMVANLILSSPLKKAGAA